MKFRSVTCALFAVCVAFGSPALASPISIQYVATDLTDTDPGDDLWQYAYYVSDFDFQHDDGFSIYFDVAFYQSLQDLPPIPNADWDPLTYQPDAVLPSPGIYDALALNDHASLSDPFVITFVWLGGRGTRPGSQPFDLYTMDPQSGAIAVFESGQTVEQVPDPP